MTLVAAELAGLPKRIAHPGNIHASLGNPYTCQHQGARRTGSPRRRSGPRGSARPAACRTPSPTRASSTRSRRPQAIDPLELRARNLKDARGPSCSSGWRSSRSGRRGGRARPAGDRARRGLTYTKYELVRTYVGMVADVEVNAAPAGKVIATCRARLRPDHQPGRAAQPDRRQRRADGGPHALRGAQFDRATDQPRLGNLSRHQVPGSAGHDPAHRPPQEKPWGAGEPTAAVVPSAIANAIFDATRRAAAVPFRSGLPRCWRH